MKDKYICVWVAWWRGGQVGGWPRRQVRGISPKTFRNSTFIFAIKTNPFSLLCFPNDACCGFGTQQYSVLNTWYSVFSTQYSVFSTQYSVFSSQHSVFSAQVFIIQYSMELVLAQTGPD